MGGCVPQGISLHFGLNQVDPDHYQGWDGKLVACEADAKDMAKLAGAQGFETQTVLTKDATAEALLTAVRDAAGKLESGDILLHTYSGHGGQVPDANGDEDDRMDETWVLYDRQVVDDELYAEWAKFKPASASRSSPTAATAGPSRVRPFRPSARIGSPRRSNGGGNGRPRTKGMPDDKARATYEHNKKLYDDIQKALPAFDDESIGASVILISGCQDNQTSLDGDKNGLFTQSLLETWHDGDFKGGYRRFRKSIAAAMPPWQSPNLFIVGAPSTKFTRQHPFTV